MTLQVKIFLRICLEKVFGNLNFIWNSTVMVRFIKTNLFSFKSFIRDKFHNRWSLYLLILFYNFLSAFKIVWFINTNLLSFQRFIRDSFQDHWSLYFLILYFKFLSWLWTDVLFTYSLRNCSRRTILSWWTCYDVTFHFIAVRQNLSWCLSQKLCF